jgi:hypothetical protein
MECGTHQPIEVDLRESRCEVNVRIAIRCYSATSPHFCDIGVSDNCNGNAESYTSDLSNVYTNDTGLDGKVLFTGSWKFQVREIEVFEIAE